MPQETAATGQGLAIKAFFKDIAATLSLKQGWSEKSLVSKAYTAALCTLLIALFPLSYEHYTIVRCIICVCVVIFYRECLTERSRNIRWLYVLIGIGLLYNPIIPVHLDDKEGWIFINIATLYLLFRIKLRLIAPETIQTNLSPDKSLNASETNET